MTESTDTNAGQDAKSGFDMEEGRAKGGDIPELPDPSDNMGEPGQSPWEGKGNQGETKKQPTAKKDSGK